MSAFTKYSAEVRRQIYYRQTKHHPDKIAVVISKHVKSQLPFDGILKYMIARDVSVNSLTQKLRKQLKTGKQSQINALYLFIKGNIVHATQKIGRYQKHRNQQDNFLYIQLAEIETF